MPSLMVLRNNKLVYITSVHASRCVSRVGQDANLIRASAHATLKCARAQYSSTMTLDFLITQITQCNEKSVVIASYAVTFYFCDEVGMRLATTSDDSLPPMIMALYASTQDAE
jgi:hypothetical protein